MRVQMRPARLAPLLSLSAILLALPACSPLNSTSPEAFEVQNSLSRLCFATATERIDRQAIPLHQLFISESGNTTGDWGFDLFFGTGKPESWGGLPALPADQKSSASGSYEIAYKQDPITTTISGITYTFRSVSITIKDLSSDTVIAERRNILFGNDFNRGWQCLDATWFRGNEAFIERVLGKRFIRPEGSVRQDFPTQTHYSKAQLLNIMSKPIHIRFIPREEVLPRGAEYLYNERKIKLRSGELHLTSGRTEPLEIVQTLEKKDRYFFVLLPGGSARSWPLRQILVEERLLSGELLRSAVVQIPPIVDWSNGWGLNPESIDIKDNVMSLQILGEKTLKKRYADQKNQGTYKKSYYFIAKLW